MLMQGLPYRKNEYLRGDFIFYVNFKSENRR